MTPQQRKIAMDELEALDRRIVGLRDEIEQDEDADWREANRESLMDAEAKRRDLLQLFPECRDPKELAACIRLRDSPARAAILDPPKPKKKKRRRKPRLKQTLLPACRRAAIRKPRRRRRPKNGK